MPAPFLPSRWVIMPYDMQGDPTVFPLLIGQGFLIEKTPIWSTKIDTSVSGVERRRALWPYPNWRFQLGYEVLRDASQFLELQRLVAFFNSKGGSNVAFFFLDHTDTFVNNMQFGTGDGTTTTFQVTRTTTVSSITFTEPVRAFVGTPTFYVNGVATAATIGQLGQITFASVPASGAVLTWTGQFLFLCRFTKDELTGLGQGNGNGFWDLKQLGFQTFKS